MRRSLSPTRLRFETLEDRSVPATLTVTVPSQVLESWSPMPDAGKVTRGNTDLSQPLTVNLASSDTTELFVQPFVTIPAGQASAPIYIEVIDDTILDGQQPVQVTAWAQMEGALVQDTTFAGGGEAPQGHLTRNVVTLWDGSIITVGQKYVGPSSTGYNFAVTKLLPNGFPDPSFGTNGSVNTDVVTGQYDYASSVAIQQDGKILVAGYTRVGTTSQLRMAVVRYLPNGLLDSTFGAGGKVVLNFGTNYSSSVWDMVVRPDEADHPGRGDRRRRIDDGELRRRQLLPNGALDAALASAARRRQLPERDRAWSVLLQQDGRIVLAGQGAGPRRRPS